MIGPHGGLDRARREPRRGARPILCRSGSRVGRWMGRRRGLAGMIPDLWRFGLLGWLGIGRVVQGSFGLGAVVIDVWVGRRFLAFWQFFRVVAGFAVGGGVVGAVGPVRAGRPEFVGRRFLWGVTGLAGRERGVGVFVAGAGLGGLRVTGPGDRVLQNGLIRYRVAFPRQVIGRPGRLVNAHGSPPARPGPGCHADSPMASGSHRTPPGKQSAAAPSPRRSRTRRLPPPRHWGIWHRTQRSAHRQDPADPGRTTAARRRSAARRSRRESPGPMACSQSADRG